MKPDLEEYQEQKEKLSVLFNIFFTKLQKFRYINAKTFAYNSFLRFFI